MFGDAPGQAISARLGLLFRNTLALFRKVSAIVGYIIALFCNIYRYYATFVPFLHGIGLFQYY